MFQKNGTTLPTSTENVIILPQEMTLLAELWNTEKRLTYDVCIIIINIHNSHYHILDEKKYPYLYFSSTQAFSLVNLLMPDAFNPSEQIV